MTSTTEEKVEARGQCGCCKRVLPVSALETLYENGVYCIDAADCGRHWSSATAPGNAGSPGTVAGVAVAPAEPSPVVPADADPDPEPVAAQESAEDAPGAGADAGQVNT